jgi:hypothetical protein
VRQDQRGENVGSGLSGHKDSSKKDSCIFYHFNFYSIRLSL